MLESLLKSSRNSYREEQTAVFLRDLRAACVDPGREDVFRRPLPRAQRKFVKPRAVCSRCERFSFLSADVGQPCHFTSREARCGGRMIATDALRDWASCTWCAGSGWHLGMCCIKCDGSGWTRSAAPSAARPAYS